MSLLGILGGIGTALGIGSGIKDFWDSWTGNSPQDKQNRANMDMARYQQAMEEELYNKYRSPAALMRQYKEAGLNPNLVYGSASAGISSSPHFNAPNVERTMSASEKVDKALSAVSSGLGLAQGIYQTQAAKEAAEQSVMKSINDSLNLRTNYGNFALNAYLNPVIPLTGYFFGRSRRNKYEFGGTPAIENINDPYLQTYYRASRENALSKLTQPTLSQAADYGLYYGGDGKLRQSNYFGTPAIRTRNAMNALKYRLSNELGNTGQFGKLIISALDLFL